MQLQVGVKICLVNSKKRILLVQRSDKYNKISGQWDIVGGRINPGTRLLENLRREIKEETGILFKGKPKLICAQDIIMSDRHVVRLTYIGKTDKNVKVKSDSEWTKYKWFTMKAMKTLHGLDKYLKEVLPLISIH